MLLGKYANIFGEPGTGIHSIRIFNVAIVDLLLTMILAYFVRLNKNYLKSLGIWLLIGLIVHYLFQVKYFIFKYNK